MERTAHVGADVDAAAVLQVAERLLEEGRSRLESSPESALVALQQAFSLEQQFGTDGERLCRACSSVCHALSRIAHPQPPVAAVEPLVQGLETLDKMRARRDAGAAIVVLDEHAQFLARELLGLARQLARVGGTATTSAATLAELRGADKAFDAMLAVTKVEPLPLASPSLVVTQQEILYQQAGVARQLGLALGAANGPRERDAATFHFHRAARKLRLANVPPEDEQLVSLQRLIAEAEAPESVASPPPTATAPAVPVVASSDGGGCAIA